MSIVFHCEHCGKKIEAPDNAGGRWGKCPGCQKRVYVPGPQPADDLRLAPLDEDEEKKRHEMLAEAARLREDILKETDVPEEGITRKPAPAAQPGALSDSELTISIMSYLRQMADGELEDAEGTARTITPCGARAVRILERIALSEVPEPELADIPPQVLAGLIKSLRSRIR